MPEEKPEGASESGEPEMAEQPVDPGAETIEQAPGSEPARKDRPESAGSASLRNKDFGEYRIISEVARGAMGIVYRAEQKRLGREVALKVMLTGEHASEGEVRRFTREAQALARLRHPNIVPIYDIGEVAGRHYFTMDFVEGQTLSQVLIERQLTVTESLHIVEQVADAVAAAHTRGVIHRDIKPSNVMLDADGGVHIMDFGLAKSSGVETKHTRDGTTIGTPAYMPPEQARGEISRVEERSDVYSIGALLYEMLSGRPPFGGTNLLEIVLAVINEDPPRPRSVNPRLPRELETIILKCMEKDSTRRYHTAAELRDELRRYQSGEPIRAQPPSFLYRARKKLRKHWVAVAAACAALALGIAGLLVVALGIKIQQTEENMVEGTKPQWKQLHAFNFSPRSLAADWQPPGSSYLDSLLDPVFARQRAARAAGRELVSRKLVYGNARAALTFSLAAPLGRHPLALGFYGDRLPSGTERTTALFRLSPGRLELAFTGDPDRTRPEPRVVADRSLPLLVPGKTYRATAQRLGIVLSFKLEELPGGEGQPSVLAELSYADVHLSHWRCKNLNVVLRGSEKTLRPGELIIEKLFLPRLASALVGADSMFFRGDYNGAFEEYQAIIVPPASGSPPAGPAERAAAHLRLGFYYEIKHDLEKALGHYERARQLVEEAGPGASEELEAAGAEALLREMAAAGRTGQYGRVFGRIDELPGGVLEGPWAWDLSLLVAELAAARPKRLNLATSLAGRLRAPDGSAVLGSRMMRLGLALVGEERETALQGLVRDWLPRLKPVPSPLLPWAELCAAAGEAEPCVGLFEAGRERLAAGNAQLVYYADRACKAFSARRQFGAVRRVISAAGTKGLKKTYTDALAKAAALKDRAGRAQAMELLRLAAQFGTGDRMIGALAARLGESYCAAGEFGQLARIWRAYPTPLLAGVYAEAALGLHRSDASVRRALRLLREARTNFGENHVGLARAAAEIGAAYADCRAENDYKVVLEAHAAYPSREHAAGLARAFEALLAKPDYDRAGEVFAYARANLGLDRRMGEATRILLAETVPREEDLEVFMGRLLEVEPRLAGGARDLAVWRLELARYHLLAGNVPLATETYERTWEEKSKAPRKLAAEARLRGGLLLALGETRGERNRAKKVLGGIEKLTGEASRPGLCARAVLERDFDVPGFRGRAAKLKMGRSEIELVLAARASLTGEESAKSARLARAYNILRQEEKSYAWPYEVLRVKYEAALRSHG